MANTKKTNLILVFILLIGLFFRLNNLKDNFNFSYDQGRDHLRIYNLIHENDFKLVGPETDIAGVFNGPLYYYLLAPGLAFFKGDPNASAYLLALINLFSIPLFFATSKVLFKNNKIALLAALLAAFSYHLVNFSHHISNASPLPITTSLFFYGLALWLKKKEVTKGFFYSILGLTLSIQLEFYYIYLIIFYFIFRIFFKLTINIKQALPGLILGFFLVFSFFISEIKFRFMGTLSLLHYLMGSDSKSTAQDFIFKYIDKLSITLSNNIFSFNYILALLVFMFMIYCSWIMLRNNREKESMRFVLIVFLSSLPLFAFKSGAVNSPEVINSSIIMPILIITALFLYKLWAFHPYIALLFLIFIIAGNFNLFISSSFTPSNLFFTRNEMLIGKQKKLIDFMYKEANGEPFSFCAVTNPLFINSTWAYLLQWYGMSQYGYLPYWSGPKQDPNFSASKIQNEPEHQKLRFIIYESDPGIPEHAIYLTQIEANKITKLLASENFGHLRVEKRAILTNKEEINEAERDYKENIPEKIKLILSNEIRYNCLY